MKIRRYDYQAPNLVTFTSLFRRNAAKPAIKIMKLKNLYLLLLLLFSPNVYGQYPTNNPSPEENRRIEQRQQQIDRVRQTESFSRLRRISDREAIRRRVSWGLGNVSNRALKPSEEDRRRVSIPDDVTATYQKFLLQENTGIVRLHDAIVCSVERIIVNVNDNCPNAYPDKATAYSFRIRDYQRKHFSDVFLEDGKLYVKGFLLLGVLSELGDQSLDDLSLSSDGIKQLHELKAPLKQQEYEKYSTAIANGVNIENHVFGNQIPLKTGRTYLFRTIALDAAFKSRFSKSVKPLFWEKDKRDDVIVVFQTVKENEDRSWIILWKELSRKNAPKINL